MSKILSLILISCLYFTANFAQAQSIQFASGQVFPAADKNINLSGGKSPTGTILPILVDASGNTQIGAIIPGTSATNLGKAEDAVAGDGDTGIAHLIKRVDTAAVQTTLAGDYQVPAGNSVGATFVDINSSFMQSNGGALLKIEDAAAASGDALVGIAAHRLTTFNSEAGEGDYSSPITDIDQRLAVNAYGADPSEFWQACGTATASTSDVAIKAAVAGNRIYVTSISCKNTSLVASTTLDFKDGSTVMSVGGIGALVAASGTSGSFTTQFPVPLKGTVNTALNFATNTAATSVTCCAVGYISTN